eukprot:1329119-Rhodomonas_salina.5
MPSRIVAKSLRHAERTGTLSMIPDSTSLISARPHLLLRKCWRQSQMEPSGREVSLRFDREHAQASWELTPL